MRVCPRAFARLSGSSTGQGETSLSEPKPRGGFGREESPVNGGRAAERALQGTGSMSSLDHRLELLPFAVGDTPESVALAAMVISAGALKTW